MVKKCRKVTKSGDFGVPGVEVGVSESFVPRGGFCTELTPNTENTENTEITTF